MGSYWKPRRSWRISQSETFLGEGIRSCITCHVHKQLHGWAASLFAKALVIKAQRPEECSTVKVGCFLRRTARCVALRKLANDNRLMTQFWLNNCVTFLSFLLQQFSNYSYPDMETRSSSWSPLTGLRPGSPCRHSWGVGCYSADVVSRPRHGHMTCCTSTTWTSPTTRLNEIEFNVKMVMNIQGEKEKLEIFLSASYSIYFLSFIGDPTFAPATITLAMISPITKRVRVTIGFLVRCRVRMKIRIRVRVGVGVTFNVRVYPPLEQLSPEQMSDIPFIMLFYILKTPGSAGPGKGPLGPNSIPGQRWPGNWSAFSRLDK